MLDGIFSMEEQPLQWLAHPRHTHSSLTSLPPLLQAPMEVLGHFQLRLPASELPSASCRAKFTLLYSKAM